VLGFGGAADALERSQRYGPGDVMELELQVALLGLETVRGHFDAARVEFLKGLRAMIDARIEDLSKTESKGTKLNVE
jgi:hypothetical protein